MRGSSAVFEQDELDGRVLLLSAYWRGILRVLPNAGSDPDQFTIQKMTGAVLMHSVFPNVLELARASYGNSGASILRRTTSSWNLRSSNWRAKIVKATLCAVQSSGDRARTGPQARSAVTQGGDSCGREFCASFHRSDSTRPVHTRSIVLACGDLRQLSPRAAGGDAEGRGGSGTIFARFRPHRLRHRRDPPLSLRDISPRAAGGEQKQVCPISQSTDSQHPAAVMTNPETSSERVNVDAAMSFFRDCILGPTSSKRGVTASVGCGVQIRSRTPTGSSLPRS